MYCITIEHGEDINQLFYYSNEKALIKMKELLENEINAWISARGEIGICLNFDHTSVADLQSILTTMIKIRFNEDDNYEDYKYEVTLSKIVFNDEPLIDSVNILC